MTGAADADNDDFDKTLAVISASDTVVSGVGHCGQWIETLWSVEWNTVWSVE